MEALIPSNIAITALYALIALALGYAIGSRRSRSHRRELQKQLNSKSIEALDSKAELNKVVKYLGKGQRKDKLLKLTLSKLQKSEDRAEMLARRLEHVEKQHYIKTSRLRLVATHASDKAKRATEIAAKASSRLKQIEKYLPASQTINAPPPKSYGQANSVPVKVVDQMAPEQKTESVARMSNWDKLRFKRLRSSNEGKLKHRQGLQAIDGLTPKHEQKLNAAGIHHINQLALLSESDLAELSITAHATDSHGQNLNYSASTPEQ
jgi:predicted flap endonuclease-1-like 5' DNA nuclease